MWGNSSGAMPSPVSLAEKIVVHALNVAGKCRGLITQLSQICRNNKEEMANGCLVLFVASRAIRNSVILLCI
jgi:hypothetical protein